MTDWTTHHFSGGQDEQGRFKGKGELQLKQVEKTILMKVKVKSTMVKVLRMMMVNMLTMMMKVMMNMRKRLCGD